MHDEGLKVAVSRNSPSSLFDERILLTRIHVHAHKPGVKLTNYTLKPMRNGDRRTEYSPPRAPLKTRNDGNDHNGGWYATFQEEDMRYPAECWTERALCFLKRASFPCPSGTRDVFHST